MLVAQLYCGSAFHLAVYWVLFLNLIAIKFLNLLQEVQIYIAWPYYIATRKWYGRSIIAERLSTRQLIVQCGLKSQLAYIYIYCTIRYNSIVFLYRRAVQYPVILDVSEFITYSITTGSYLDWLLQSCCIETGFVAIQLFQQG